ncbi:MAG: hypothetical protein D6704_09275 [Nitrospirae bacterium]|nr:MAG: hypothetical protein D6704_09275 [Nitrospirota bacterium]
MQCHRCNGLMVVEDCVDIKGGQDGFWIRALRCVSCGNLLDPMIARHRTYRPPQEEISFQKKRIRRAPRTPVAPRLIA